MQIIHKLLGGKDQANIRSVSVLNSHPKEQPKYISDRLHSVGEAMLEDACPKLCGCLSARIYGKMDRAALSGLFLREVSKDLF